MSKPLEGIKVVEIAQEIQGPFASLVLADMGADVVKVENKETGDLSRWMLTALIGGPDVHNATVSHYFIAMNRGKRSITADLKKPDAIEMVRRMVKSYDVLVTNYRPGVLDRLGPGYNSGAQNKPAYRVRPRQRVGPARPVGDPPQPRHPRAGGQRRDGENRDAGRSAARGRDVRRRSFGRAQPGKRRAGCPVRTRAHRQGAEGRRVDLWHDDRDAGDGDKLHFDHWRRARARRPRSSVSARRVGRVPHPRRLHLYCGRGRETRAGVLPNRRNPAP